jgi:hypothetical protein
VEELGPAAKIHVSWKSIFGNNMAVGGFLKRELFGAADSIASSFPEAKPILPEKTAQLSVGSSNVGNNDEAPSKEEVLMARMMGKGLFGAKASKGPSGGGGGQDEKNAKPKWFK